MQSLRSVSSVHRNLSRVLQRRLLLATNGARRTGSAILSVRSASNVSLAPTPTFWRHAVAPTTMISRRSMVMVTKTEAGSLPVQEEAPAQQQLDNNSPPAASTPLDTNADLIITDACWKQILRLAARKDMAPSDMFLRLYVDAGGCSGFEYKFEVETDGALLEDDDRVWQGPDGARVVVDTSSLAFVQGATLDYVVEMIKSAFVVKENPQSETACGCGSSFAVKNFSANPALD